MTTRWRLVAFLGCFALVRPVAGALPSADPAAVGLDAARLTRIDAVVERSIADKQFPGAVVIVGRDGRIALAKAYGQRAVVPAAEPMTRDTIFDMASLTKPIATATVGDDPARARQDPPG